MNISAKFGWPVLVAAVISVIATDVAMGQGRGRGAQFARGFGGGNSALQLLTNEKIQSELELVDDQLEQIRELQQAQRDSWRELFAEMGDVPREDRREMMGRMREKLEEQNKNFAAQANEILLPHQRDRLKQLEFRAAGRGRGAGGTLSNQRLLDELGVTDEQREKLEQATEKAREKVAEAYQKIIADAEKDILKVLTAEQRETYQRLVGKPFEFESGEARFRGRNREGEGNRRPQRDF